MGNVVPKDMSPQDELANHFRLLGLVAIACWIQVTEPDVYDTNTALTDA